MDTNRLTGKLARIARRAAAFIIVLISLTLAGCSGGGGAGDAAAPAISDRTARLAFELSAAAGPDMQSVPLPSDGFGSVEIVISRIDPATGAATPYRVVTADYSARRADVEVMAGDTYAVTITARIRPSLSDLSETVYTRSSTVFAAGRDTMAPPETGGANYFKMALARSGDIKLAASYLTIDAILPAARAGLPLPPLVVTILDQFRRPLAGAQGTVEVTSDPAGISGTLVRTPSGGRASFDSLSFAKAGVYKIKVSSGSASSSVAISVVPAGAASAAAALSFDPAPPAIVRSGAKLPTFGVRSLDAAGTPVDDSGSVTLSVAPASASQGAGVPSLSGTTQAAFSSGEARFADVTLTGAGSVRLVASAAGLSAATPPIEVTAGEVRSNLLVIGAGHFIYAFDLYSASPADAPEKITACAAVFKWAFPVLEGVRRVEFAAGGAKLFVLAGGNVFYSLEGLDSAAPSSARYNLRGDASIERFAASADGYRVYLAARSAEYDLVYKWHIVNDPDFLAVKVPISGPTAINGIAVTGPEKLLVALANSVIPVDFTDPAGRAGIMLPIAASPAAIECAENSAFIAEGDGPSIYRVDSATGVSSIFAVSGSARAAGAAACLKYCPAAATGGEAAMIFARSSDGAVYRYSLPAGSETAWHHPGRQTLYPAGIATAAGGRAVLVASGGNSAFVRAIDARTGTFVADLAITGPGGAAVFENISCVVVR